MSPVGVNSTNIPSLLVLDEDNTLLTINTPETTDLGQHIVNICSTIYDSRRSKACVQFEIVVEQLQFSNVTVSVVPEWIANLQNQ